MSSIALISRPEPDPWVPTGPFATPSATSMAPLDWVLASRSTCNSQQRLSSRDLHLFFKARSEEHTSELQSQSNLVCRLLLEKKKNKSLSTISRIEYTST